MPDSLLKNMDPHTTPFLLGMVVKFKDWAAVKGFVAVMAFAITASSTMSVFYTQTNAMMAENKSFRQEVTRELVQIKVEMALVKQSIALTNNNVEHFVNNLTAKVDQMQSTIAKIRR